MMKLDLDNEELEALINALEHFDAYLVSHQATASHKPRFTPQQLDRRESSSSP